MHYIRGLRCFTLPETFFGGPCHRPPFMAGFADLQITPSCTWGSFVKREFTLFQAKTSFVNLNLKPSTPATEPILGRPMKTTALIDGRVAYSFDEEANGPSSPTYWARMRGRCAERISSPSAGSTGRAMASIAFTCCTWFLHHMHHIIPPFCMI
jgi:hypothetical protein